MKRSFAAPPAYLNQFGLRFGGAGTVLSKMPPQKDETMPMTYQQKRNELRKQLADYCKLCPHDRFARDILAAFNEWGSLTPRQDKAIRQHMALHDPNWLKAFSALHDTIVGNVNTLLQGGSLGDKDKASVLRADRALRDGRTLSETEVGLLDEIGTKAGLSALDCPTGGEQPDDGESTGQEAT